MKFAAHRLQHVMYIILWNNKQISPYQLFAVTELSLHDIRDHNA